MMIVSSSMATCVFGGWIHRLMVTSLRLRFAIHWLSLHVTCLRLQAIGVSFAMILSCLHLMLLNVLFFIFDVLSTLITSSWVTSTLILAMSQLSCGYPMVLVALMKSNVCCSCYLHLDLIVHVHRCHSAPPTCSLSIVFYRNSPNRLTLWEMSLFE